MQARHIKKRLLDSTYTSYNKKHNLQTLQSELQILNYYLQF